MENLHDADQFDGVQGVDSSEVESAKDGTMTTPDTHCLSCGCELREFGHQGDMCQRIQTLERSLSAALRENVKLDNALHKISNMPIDTWDELIRIARKALND